MKKVFLDYSDWKDILFGGTGLRSMEQELIDNISNLASRNDVSILLTENGKPTMVLKFDKLSAKFTENQIL